MVVIDPTILMIGPPGTGKTMLARRVASILPPLSLEEAIEVTAVWSVAGLLPAEQGMLTARPFRSPHHTASEAGLIGGGGVPHTGEISFAHHGVLFRTSCPGWFSSPLLEALCQPLEDARAVASRVAGTAAFPALPARRRGLPCPPFPGSCATASIHTSRFSTLHYAQLADAASGELSGIHCVLAAGPDASLGPGTSPPPSRGLLLDSRLGAVR